MSDLNILDTLRITSNKTKDYANKHYANALIGKASGQVVSLDDVSPFDCNVSVKISRKNLIPYPYTKTTFTANGITFTDNKDGSITINGTATDGIFFEVYKSVYALPNGINNGNNYVLSCEGKTDGVTLVCNYYPIGATSSTAYKHGAWQVSGASGEAAYVVKTIPDDWQGIYLYVYVTKDKTLNTTIYPQIELGTSATAYVPYVADGTAVTVRSCGKNLFDIESVAQEIVSSFPNFCSIEMFEGRRCLKVGGIYSTIVAPVVADPNIIHFNAYSLGYANSIFTIKYTDGSANYVGATVGQWKEISYAYTNKAIKSLDFYCEASKDNAVYIDLDSFMVEKNTAPTDYEPYIEGETKTTAVGESVELNSIAPNMTISTDNEGVIIEATYNKDFNGVIEKLAQAIISLGGTV